MRRAIDKKEPVPGPSTSASKRRTQKDGAHNKPGKNSDAIAPENTSKKLDTKTCVHGPEQEYQPPTFDYLDHMEFNRLQVLLSKVQRMKDVKPNVPNCVAEPSRELLMNKFTEMYGPVDFESPEMGLILQQMKDAVMEQEELDYDEIKTQLWDEGIDACGPADAEAQLKELISQKFEEKTQQSYSTFNPREASGEWFMVPRGDPTKVRLSYFQGAPNFTRTYVLENPPDPLKKKEPEEEHAESASQTYKKMLMASNQPLQNLHLYDPKFEYVLSVGGSMLVTSSMHNFPLLSRLVPFVGVASAVYITTPTMRSQELIDGIPVFDEKGYRVGNSVVAAQHGINRVCLSRIIGATPVMVIPPIIMNYLQKDNRLLIRHPKLHNPIQVLVVGCCLVFATPLCCAIFPQKSSISTSKLESEIQEKVAKLPHSPKFLYYNKGL